ncbi:MAG: MurR/RpiR family transcriptional regulator [Chloroflexota bacterium]|nr:MurR/RpiR family transcriptional regulator [Chloroflexota bacterium]
MFRERIQANYKDLTPSFRKLADFILQQPLDIAFMTATEVGHTMEMDAATVVRFAQYLGYSGFRELIKEIQRIVKAELIASYTTVLDAPDDAGLFRSLLENERNNLSLAQARLTEQANTVLPALLGAQRIWVLGQGACAHLAALCASSLREIGLPAISIPPDPLSAAPDLKESGAEDVVVAFSLTGMDLEAADAINFARQRGAKTLAFSASPVTAAALAAEMVIICPGPTHVHVPSFTGLVAMIVVLVAAYVARYPEKAAEMKADMQQGYHELLELQARSSSEVNVEELWREF